jgi:hypothetical protein
MVRPAPLDDDHVPAGFRRRRLNAFEDFGEAWIAGVRDH